MKCVRLDNGDLLCFPTIHIIIVQTGWFPKEKSPDSVEENDLVQIKAVGSYTVYKPKGKACG